MTVMMKIPLMTMMMRTHRRTVKEGKEALEAQRHKCAKARELQTLLSGVTHQGLDDWESLERALVGTDEPDDLQGTLKVDSFLIF